MKECPKCGIDISDTLQEDDPDVGITGGYYCETCDEGFPYEPEYFGDEVITSIDTRDIGTPLSEISTRPGEPGYAEWIRISKSYGHD